jgi:hypothetical protein
VTPALFVPYFLWKRSWGALAGVGAGMVLFLWPGLVPACFVGWERNLEQTNNWVQSMVKPFLVDGVVTSEHHNQSLPGLVYRLFTDSPSFVVYVNNVWTPDRYHNVLSLDPAVARMVVKISMGLFVLLVVWTCRSPRGNPAARTSLAAEYSVVVLGMLLFSERTWKHHCVTLILPFAVLSYRLVVDRDRKGERAFLIASLAVVVLLMSTTSTSLLGKEGGKLFQVYGAFVYAYFVLLGVLAHVLRHPTAQNAEGRRRNDAESSSPRPALSVPRSRAG